MSRAVHSPAAQPTEQSRALAPLPASQAGDPCDHLAQARPALWRYAMCLCRDTADADDLVQRTLLRALEVGYEHVPPDRLPVWLRTVGRNIFVDTWRLQNSHFRLLERLTDRTLDAPAPWDELEERPEEPRWADFTGEDVREAAERLPIHQHQVLMMCDFEGRSYGDVARALGIERSTVGSRLYRARRRLRQKMSAPGSRTHRRLIDDPKECPTDIATKATTSICVRPRSRPHDPMDEGSTTEEGGSIFGASGADTSVIVAATCPVGLPGVFPGGAHVEARCAQSGPWRGGVIGRLALPAPALAKEGKESKAGAAETAVLAAQEDFKQALIKKDRAGFEKVLHADLRYGHSDGHIEDKATAIKMIVDGAANWESVNFADTNVRLRGDTAFVTGKVQYLEREKGQLFDINLVVLSVWVKEGKRWQLLARQATRPVPAKTLQTAAAAKK